MGRVRGVVSPLSVWPGLVPLDSVPGSDQALLVVAPILSSSALVSTFVAGYTSDSVHLDDASVRRRVVRSRQHSSSVVIANSVPPTDQKITPSTTAGRPG